MCYRPLSFVCEARVQQGLTAWAFKSVSLAGTKTEPLHHEGSDNLINVTIYSTHPSACLLAPRCSPAGNSIELNKPFEFWSSVRAAPWKRDEQGASTGLVKIFVFILFGAGILRAEQSWSALLPTGPWEALFSTLSGAFTVLLLHFSPLATFDALGPQLFPSVVCVFFFSQSLSFPSHPPFLSFYCSSSLSALPSPWSVEVELLAAWEPVL